jgi:hypothetical protein
MGLLLLPVVLLPFVLRFELSRRALANNWFRLALAAAVLVPASFLVWNISYIGPKLAELYFRAVHQSAGWELSRIGAAMFDWQYIVERPFFGWGQSNESQYALTPSMTRFALGNGLTGFARQMGLVGVAIFFLSFWGGLKRAGVPTALALYSAFVSLLILTGEYFLDYPLYMALLFLGLGAVPQPVRLHPRAVALPDTLWRKAA